MLNVALVMLVVARWYAASKLQRYKMYEYTTVPACPELFSVGVCVGWGASTFFFGGGGLSDCEIPPNWADFTAF